MFQRTLIAGMVIVMTMGVTHVGASDVSEFESLAILDANGEPLVIAGDFPADFAVWSEVPAFQASLAGSAASTEDVSECGSASLSSEP